MAALPFRANHGGLGGGSMRRFAGRLHADLESAEHTCAAVGTVGIPGHGVNDSEELGS